MELKITKSGLNIATQHYTLSNNKINSVHDLHTEVGKLKSELKKHDDLWGDERHNLDYGIYFRGLRNFKY